jgi:hypothetical protein
VSQARPAFDPARSISFDLGRGEVRLTSGEQHILLSPSVVSTLLERSPFAREIGRSSGEAIAERARNRARSADETLRGVHLAKVVDLVGGELALLGIGNLRIERWGKALLFVLDPCPLDARADSFLAGLIEGAVYVAGGREVGAVVVDRGEDLVRLFVGTKATVTAAEAMRNEGALFTEVVSRLQEQADRESP